MPKAADIALGASGGAVTPKTPNLPVEDIALGTAGAGAGQAMSLDLADQMPVRADDVKEAVRASKVMTAVEVPKDLLEALEEKPKATEPAVAPVVAKAPEPEVAPVIAKAAVAKAADKPAQQQGGGNGNKKKDKNKNKGGKQADAPKAAEPVATGGKASEAVVAKAADKVADKVADKPAAKVADRPADKAIVKAKDADKKPVVAERKQPVAPPAPASRTSPALIWLLVLVLLAGAGYVVYRYVLNKPTTAPTTSGQVTPAPPPVANPAGPAAVTPGSGAPAPGSGSAQVAAAQESDSGSAAATPPLPESITGSIEIKAMPPVPVASTFEGTLAQFAATGAAVKKGNKIGLLQGFRALDATILKLQRDLAKLQAQQAALEAAAAGAAAGSGDLVVGGEVGGRDAVEAAAAATKRQARQDALTKTVNEKQYALDQAIQERTKFDIYAQADGTLTSTAKIGAKLTQTTILGSIEQTPVPLVTFPLAVDLRFETSTQQVVYVGPEMTKEQQVTCYVRASLPESITLECPASDRIQAGTVVTWKIPKL